MGDAAVAISDGRLSAEISPLGAELQALRDGQGRDLLWNGDPAWWTGRAPLLFPIVGMLPDDRYRLGGETYHLPKHGFARRATFDVVERAAGGATFRLEDSESTRAAWPFAFRLDVRFAIADGRLTATAEVANTGDRTMPFSFGFHPAFRWPLPGGAPRAAHEMVFDQPEPAPIRRVSPDGLLTPKPHPSPIAGRTLKLDDSLFVDDAIIMPDLASRSLVYGAEGGTRLRIGWEGLPDLGIWMKPRADYVCVEPWAGFATPQGFEGDLTEKPGIVLLPAGETRRFTLWVEQAG